MSDEPKTEEREVSITLFELRDATLAMTEALSESPRLESIRKDHDRLPLVHAYMLGAVMRAAGIQPSSVGVLFKFVKLGFEDFEGVNRERECDG